MPDSTSPQTSPQPDHISVNTKLWVSAADISGSQYQSEQCAIAVTDVFKHAGLSNMLPAGNDLPIPGSGSDWVPNWYKWGMKISTVAELEKGDVVIMNFGGDTPDPWSTDTNAGYSHIGIYKGGGEYWNVSSANDHRFVATNLDPAAFQEGRRPHP